MSISKTIKICRTNLSQINFLLFSSITVNNKFNQCSQLDDRKLLYFYF